MTSERGAIPGLFPISGIAIPECSYSAPSGFRNSPENKGLSYSAIAIPKLILKEFRNSAENQAIPLFPLQGDLRSGIARPLQGPPPRSGRAAA